MADRAVSACFSAVLLAGGASRRMGRDKALLKLPASREFLWQRQWRTLKALKPRELLWSGPPRPQMPEEARVVPDAVLSAGPLAGISACLDGMATDLLVVLAVDLPQMTSEFLRALLDQSTSTSGAVVARGDFFEPLAAVYPQRLETLAREHLRQGRFALQDFVREAVAEGALRQIPLENENSSFFRNLNAPADLGEN